MHSGTNLDFAAIEANKSLALRDYWRKRLQGCKPEPYFYGFYSNTGVKRKGDVATYSRTVSREVLATLNRLAPKAESRHVVLVATLGILLQRLSGLPEVIIFSPAYQRKLSLPDNCVVPLRIHADDHLKVKDFLLQLSNKMLQDFSYARYPLRNILGIEEEELKDIPVVGVMLDEVRSDFAFEKVAPECIFSFEAGDSLTLKMLYNRDAFDKSSIIQLTDLYCHLLGSIVNNTNDRIYDIDLVSEEEEVKIIHEFNNTQAEYPFLDTIVSLFTKQVASSSGKIAVRFGDVSWTYQELDYLSSRIATYLRKDRGVLPGHLVGVMLQREELLLPVIYGVLKAGAAYVPLDVVFPAQRISEIISDSKLNVLIGRRRNTHSSLSDLEIFSDLDDLVIPEADFSLPEVSLTPRDLAYVIYTSGTTGMPKGVMVEHGSVVNRINWMQKEYPLSEKDVVMQKTPTTFDVSVWELFWWSFYGASVCLLPPEAEKDPKEVARAIGKFKVTTIHFVPSMLSVFLEFLAHGLITDLKSLRLVFCSGEALRPIHVEAFGALVKDHHVRLINLYGPTEATVDVSYFECRFDEEYKDVPIGKPIDNIRLFVVDQSMSMVPIGMTGELVIAGIGLARGYLNNPYLTDEKFVSVAALDGIRVYRTGDLARFRPDGNIEYLGRRDHQVKIRGYRIELGDIESHLTKHNLIRDAVVVVRNESDDKFLAAYYVATEELEANQLRNFLLERLPVYMIPLHFISMARIPLTSNGKVDRKALPSPSDVAAPSSYVKAGNAIEEKLVGIWSKILNIERKEIGIRHNFFELGGQSIKAAQLIQSVEQFFLVDIGLKKIFDYPTIEGQARLVVETSWSAEEPIRKAEDRESYPASSSQERLFCVQMLNKNDLVNNCSYAYKVDGELDIKRLNDTLNSLLKRHSGLRANFFLTGKKVWQSIRKTTTIQIEIFNSDELTPVDAFSQFIRPFDLANDLLMRVGLLPAGDQKNFMFVDIHHIVCDGISINILMNEFKRVYNGEDLPSIALEYVDYACWQRNSENALSAQRRYWLEHLSGDLSAVELPGMLGGAQGENIEGRREWAIGGETGTGVRELAVELGATPFMIFLSVYYILISKLSGSSEVIIGTDTIGRTRQSLMNIVGTFINVLPLRVRITGELLFVDLLEQVRNVVLSASENQEFPYDEIIHLLGNVRHEDVVNLYFSNADFFQNEIEPDGLAITPVVLKKKPRSSRYLLELTLEDRGDEYLMGFRYNSDRFDESVIELFVSYYAGIVRSVVREPSIRVQDLKLGSFN
ncbi:MAG: amino acid adenylation domain-containing protein [Chryseotalea sp. WA131a]|nr:MAG: amino acid adenylation domain-containing protein [Chryseotalea sp. WA131a]